jgi:hypothetical protein
MGMGDREHELDGRQPKISSARRDINQSAISPAGSQDVRTSASDIG